MEFDAMRNVAGIKGLIASGFTVIMWVTCAIGS